MDLHWLASLIVYDRERGGVGGRFVLHLGCLHVLVLLFGALASTGDVDLPENRVKQVQHIDSDIKANEVQEVIGELIARLRALHKVGEVEHEPDANKHNRLIQDLKYVVRTIHHRPNYNVEANEESAEEVSYSNLKHDRELEVDDGQCKEQPSHEEVERVRQSSSLVVVQILVRASILGLRFWMTHMALFLAHLT